MDLKKAPKVKIISISTVMFKNVEFRIYGLGDDERIYLFKDDAWVDVKTKGPVIILD